MGNLMSESDNKMIHLSDTAKEILKLQKKHPELANMDIAQIIDVAQTNLKTMNYVVSRILS